MKILKIPNKILPIPLKYYGFKDIEWFQCKHFVPLQFYGFHYNPSDSIIFCNDFMKIVMIPCKSEWFIIHCTDSIIFLFILIESYGFYTQSKWFHVNINGSITILPIQFKSCWFYEKKPKDFNKIFLGSSKDFP